MKFIKSLLIVSIFSLIFVSQSSAVTFTFFADANSTTSDTPPQRFALVIASMKAKSPSFAVNAGDSIRDTTGDSLATSLYRWNKYLAVENLFRVPVYRTSGDNDRIDQTNRYTAFRQLFGSEYSHRIVSGIHFLLLDSPSGYIDQKTWLLNELAKIERPSTIIIVTHYPLISGKTTKYYASHPPTDLMNAFSTYGVDIVLQGDTHVYRRTIVGKVTYIQTHPSGSTPRNIGVSPIPPLKSGEFGQGGSYGYVLLRTNSDRSITLNRCTVSSTGTTYTSSSVLVKDNNG